MEKITVLEDNGGVLVHVENERKDDFWVPRSDRRLVVATPKPQPSVSQDAVRYYTGLRAKLALEMYAYVKDQGPLFEPTGIKGKQLQANWRELQGLKFIDPMGSGLSTWLGPLEENGLIFKDSAGNWHVTDKEPGDVLVRPRLTKS